MRESATRLGRASADEIREMMATEVAAGRARQMAFEIRNPQRQLMVVWETSDGGVVRLKPLGDGVRPGPTVSVEVKIDPDANDCGPTGIAFKLDPQGRPVPRSMYQAASPYPEGSLQDEAFESALLNAAHWYAASR